MKLGHLILKTTTVLNVLMLVSSLIPIAAMANPQTKQLTQNEALITERVIIAQSRSRTGAWSTVDTDNPEVKKAAEKAISLQAQKIDESLELISIETAKRQVVAGMNYNLILKVNRNDQETIAMAIIWGKPDGSYQLTEWWWKG